jgi:micrococcal nuclease
MPRDILTTRDGPDRHCKDVSGRNFRVVGADPHRFDGDGDGVGYEG